MTAKNERPPGGAPPSLRILPPGDDEDGPDSSERSADGSTEGDSPSGSDDQRFYRILYTAVVWVALAVVIALVWMLLTGREIPVLVMLALGALVSYALFPLIYRILTDTPSAESSLEKRKTLEAVTKIFLAFLMSIGLLAIRSFFGS